MLLSVGVVFITYRSEAHLASCIPPIATSALHPKILIVNSGPDHGTAAIAKDWGAEVMAIDEKEFNHGITREIARKKIGTDIVVMMTPDAYATGTDFLERLIEPLLSGQAAFAYARQVAHNTDDFFENFPRRYNYPQSKEIQLITLQDVKRLKVKTFFCSNSCAAYLNKVLDEIGGFPETLTAEDYLVSIKIIQRGYTKAYVPEAIVKHSHKYSLKEEFKRNFDTGYIRNKNIEIEQLTGATEMEGINYAISFVKATVQEKPAYLLYAICILISKYAGFMMGYRSNWLQESVKKKCSSQPYYWNSIYYKPYK